MQREVTESDKQPSLLPTIQSFPLSLLNHLPILSPFFALTFLSLPFISENRPFFHSLSSLRTFSHSSSHCRMEFDAAQSNRAASKKFFQQMSQVCDLLRGDRILEIVLGSPDSIHLLAISFLYLTAIEQFRLAIAMFRVGEKSSISPFPPPSSLLCVSSSLTYSLSLSLFVVPLSQEWKA